MRAMKLLICNLAIVSGLFVSGIVKAETCYDPDYNQYFYCEGSGYYYDGGYSDRGYSERRYSEENTNNEVAAFAFGAILGAAAGYGAGDHGDHGGHHGGHHGGGGHHNH
jgi:hypothetical protein